MDGKTKVQQKRQGGFHGGLGIDAKHQWCQGKIPIRRVGKKTNHTAVVFGFTGLIQPKWVDKGPSKDPRQNDPPNVGAAPGTATGTAQGTAHCGEVQHGEVQHTNSQKRSNPKESGQMDFIFKPSKVDLLQFV
jgi:hypothetical protein